jgi:hypothetical protein
MNWAIMATANNAVVTAKAMVVPSNVFFSFFKTSFSLLRSVLLAEFEIVAAVMPWPENSC